jgi:membrane-bound lytic murein transglycosylase MltF
MHNCSMPPHRACLSACLFAALLIMLLQPPRAGAEPELGIDLKNNIWRGDLDVLTAHRAIRVLVPYSKTLYFVDYGGTQRGLCYDFMRAFEDSLNQKLARGNLRIHAVFVPVPRDQLIPMLLAGVGDVVAANLTVTPARSTQVDFITPVATGVQEIIVTGPQAPALRSLDDLSGKEVYVQPSSSYFDSLTRLNEEFRMRRMAPIKLRNAPGHFETEDLLEMANAGLTNIVVADDYPAKFWKEIFPNIELHPDLVVRNQGDIAFAIRKDSPKLKAELDEFAKSHRVGTLFGNVDLQKYLQQTRWARNAVSQEEVQKFDTMVSLFHKYGKEYEVDWLLMAAQGYQESQLDQTRRSQAGAIGVMQLTAATGEQMGVGDIHELDANIHAGIKYVRFMVDTYFAEDHLDNLNKVLFAIASYNAGPNRVRELRKQAAEQQLNPNIWFDNVERIASEKIGRETVQYVSNIYKYYIAYTLVQDDPEFMSPPSPR